MTSLKEIKKRISTVKTTRKITQVRQTVSLVQLHHAQKSLEVASQYSQDVEEILTRITNSEEAVVSSSLSEERTEGQVAVIIMSSNSGMCGAFNSRIIKELDQINKSYGNEQPVFYPIGKKIRHAIVAGNLAVEGDFDNLANRIAHEDVVDITNHLIELFKKKRFKRVDMFYYHFKSIASQDIVHETLLPFNPPAQQQQSKEPDSDYIIEPSIGELVEELAHISVTSKLFAALASNHASEHAARTIAMQLATENANNILDELQLTYNKVRQQNITAELLDIIGSSFA